MGTLPYGFDVRLPNMSDDPWTRLDTINEHLESCEPIPADLALWLGQAITYGNGDAAEFMRRLGLKKGRGRLSHKHAENSWLTWGARVCELEDQGRKPEEAFSEVMQEYSNTVSDHGVERSTLQKWRDTYRKANVNPE